MFMKFVKQKTFVIQILDFADGEIDKSSDTALICGQNHMLDQHCQIRFFSFCTLKDMRCGYILIIILHCTVHETLYSLYKSGEIKNTECVNKDNRHTNECKILHYTTWHNTRRCFPL